MGWMALVCLRSPESGPLPSELVAHPPSPPPKQPSWGRGSAQVAGAGEGKWQSLPHPYPSSLLAPGRSCRGKWHLRTWLQWSAPGASRNPQARQ